MKHPDALNLPKKMKITDPDEIHVMEMYRQFNGDLLGFSLNNVVSFSFLEWKKNPLFKGDWIRFFYRRLNG